jgi:hypothetical protein
MKTKPFLTIFFFASMLILSCSRGSFDIIIKDVNIIDVHTGELMTNKAIGISMGEITKISNIPLRSTSDQTIHIDGRDKFVIPGLCDNHTHLAFLTTTGGDTLATELADFTHQGVLFVRDVGGPIDVMNTLKERITSGELCGPEIFYTGPMLESTPLYWSAFNKALPDFTVALDHYEDVDSLFLDFAGKDATMVKTFNNIKPELYPHIVEVARKYHLKIVHDPGSPLFNWIPINEALEMGVTSIEHAKAPWPYVLKDEYREKHDSLIGPDIGMGQQMNLMFQIAELGTATISEKRLEDLAVLMNESKSVLCPTLHVFKDWEEESQDNPAESELSEEQKTRKTITAGMKEVSDYFVQELSKYGVRMLVGQDGIDADGTSEEMVLMKEAGVPNVEVLRGATIYAAEWLEVDGKYGSVETGKIADLVVLNANPLDDIAVVSDIYMVIQHGEIIETR